MTLDAEVASLLRQHWTFLDDTWPVFQQTKRHRTVTKDIPNVDQVKKRVLASLGPIPVFFFLVELFGVRDYSGPFRNVEKGILLLYHLLEGGPMTSLSMYIPSSSLYTVYKEFYIDTYEALDAKLDDLLSHMFSNIRLRIHSARAKNPEYFKHITLLLDGHDTRATYARADKPSMYSYKLKGSGYRTQVCTDVNDMVVFVSDSCPCRDYNDGTMLSQIHLSEVMHQMDCMGLDGGYTLVINQVLDQQSFKSQNFCCPIRKKAGVELTEHEKEFNAAFGSFRSKVEAVFGELRATFQRFGNKKTIKSEESTFNVQLKLAFVLLNIRRIASTGVCPQQPHHLQWLEPGFDYNITSKPLDTSQCSSESVHTKLQDANALTELQEKFLTQSVDDMHEESENFEVEKIIGHKGKGSSIKFLVRWKGYKEATWVNMKDFNQTDCISQYWKSKS